MKKLILIDSNALVHRAFHALPPTLKSPQGEPTNAVYGFTAVLIKMLKDLKPDYIAATFDLPGPTFRHQEYKEYKAHRVKAPDELYAQIPLVKEVLTSFGIPIFEQKGVEADDIIGTLAQKNKKDKDLQIIIVTGDMDTLQLVRDDKTVVFTLRKGINDTVTYDEKEVKNRYGLAPDQMRDYKGLRGDPSDNIPGVKGIGEKTAATLLQKFGTLEKLYEAVEKNTTGLSESVIAKLKENKEMAFFSKKLATIVCDVAIDFSAKGGSASGGDFLKRAQWRQHFDIKQLEKIFQEFGFNSLLKRLPEALGTAIELPKQSSLLLDAEIKAPTPINSKGELVGHDLKPFIKELLLKNKPLPKKFFDTRIAAWLLDPDLKNYPAGDDLLAMRHDLWEKLKSANLIKVFEDIEMPLIPVLAQMELAGIKIDIASLKKLLKSTSAKTATLEKEIYKLAETEFNINSPQQLGDILFNKLMIRGKVRKTGGGAPSTAAPELEKIQDEHPIIPKILEYRELQKLKTTYIEPFPALLAKDGRIHTTYNQTGAATGRLSSQDPNLQNIPTRTELGQEFRKAFITETGFKLVTFDYSQLELRIAAHIAKDEKMIDAFKRGEDIHTRTAAEIFKVSADQVTKDMRRQAKVLNFGILYGMGSLGFARAAGVDRNTARKFIDDYFQEFSGVAQYMNDEKARALKHGFVQTIFGRRRPLPDIQSGIPQLVASAERMAINHPIQGTEADLIKLAMVEIYKYLNIEKLNLDVRILLQVHDELVFEIRDDLVKTIAPKIKAIMEQVHKFIVPITVDVASGDNWAETERHA